MMDLNGDYRIIELNSIKYNLELGDNFFEFQIMEDMEVIKTGH